MKPSGKKPYLIITAAVLIAAVTGGMLVFSGCFGGKKYKVNYNGQKSSFTNARDSYRAGEKVRLYYNYKFIATDTDYSFYLDDKRLNPLYEEDKGYVVEFTMPEREVSLRVESKNTMLYDANGANSDGPVEEDMLVDYYTATVGTDGGDDSRELVLYYLSDEKARISVFVRDGEHETQDDYIVPYKAYEECQEVISRNEFGKWNDTYDNIGLDGAVTVVRYRKDDGSYERVSTDQMPDDGESKLGEVLSVMNKYVKDEYKK